MPRYVIHNNRYLKGHWHPENKDVFVIHHGNEPQFIAASPDYPATVEVEDGYKVDKGMRPMSGTEAEPMKLKKHYAEAGAPHPQSMPVAATAESKAQKGIKRASDTSPV